MASWVEETYCSTSQTNAIQLDNQELIPQQQSVVQFREDISTLPCDQLNFPPNGNGSLVKQELQTLWEMFTSWLRPEKHSKEQIISQLVLEQFFLTGRCKDKFALLENWESSGRNMGRFMEGLTDECLKPPVMVLVSMQHQKALCSENMSLKEVIKYLKQQATPMLSPENSRRYLQIHQDMFSTTGTENSEDGFKNPWHTSERNSSVDSHGELYHIHIIQTDQNSEPRDSAVSHHVPERARKTNVGTFRYPGESLRTHSSENVTMEAKPDFFCRLDQTKDKEDSLNAFWNAGKINCGISSPENEIDSCLLTQTEYSESGESSVLYGVDGLTQAPQGTLSPLGYLSRAPSEDVLEEVLRQDLPSSVPLQPFLNNEANSTHQERLNK